MTEWNEVGKGEITEGQVYMCHSGGSVLGNMHISV